MIKRFVFSCFIVMGVYLLFLFVRLQDEQKIAPTDTGTGALQGEEALRSEHQKVYSFSFSKYTTEGEKELEIEGDSADILAKVVQLKNVIAKAYANEKPVTITADKGIFDKGTSGVHLEENVVATSNDGATLLSDSLDIDVHQKVLYTEDQARVERDNIKLEGKGARGDSEMKRMHFKKNVTVVISSEDKAAPPTVITCDGPLEINYEDNIARFNQNVVATDERGRLTADSMDVFYDKTTHRVYKIIAMGNVIIEQGGNVTYSDNVIYLANEGRMILGGDPEAVYYPESDPFSGKESPNDYLFFDGPSLSGIEKERER